MLKRARARRPFGRFPQEPQRRQRRLPSRGILGQRLYVALMGDHQGCHFRRPASSWHLPSRRCFHRTLLHQPADLGKGISVNAGSAGADNVDAVAAVARGAPQIGRLLIAQTGTAPGGRRILCQTFGWRFFRGERVASGFVRICSGSASPWKRTSITRARSPGSGGLALALSLDITRITPHTEGSGDVAGPAHR